MGRQVGRGGDRLRARGADVGNVHIGLVAERVGVRPPVLAVDLGRHRQAGGHQLGDQGVDFTLGGSEGEVLAYWLNISQSGLVHIPACHQSWRLSTLASSTVRNSCLARPRSTCCSSAISGG